MSSIMSEKIIHKGKQEKYKNLKKKKRIPLYTQICKGRHVHRGKIQIERSTRYTMLISLLSASCNIYST